jgi:hypothetical protein
MKPDSAIKTRDKRMRRDGVGTMNYALSLRAGSLNLELILSVSDNNRP